MKLGGHVSATGGISKSVERIVSIGGNCLQIFISSPRGWRKTFISDDEVATFKAAINEAGIAPVFIHALYLGNLATDRNELLDRSTDALSHALRTADRIGAQGVVFHTNSGGTRPRDEAVEGAIAAVKQVLHKTPGYSQLIIEGSAGQAGHVGSTFDELGAMVRGIGSERVKICLDTCHAFQAGYDLRTTEAITKTLKEFDEKVGLERLVVIHANDSKKHLGGGADRHANIGQGEIGRAGFKALLHHPKLRHLPWILEVPGMDGQSGPDKPNLDLLKEFAA